MFVSYVGACGCVFAQVHGREPAKIDVVRDLPMVMHHFSTDSVSMPKKTATVQSTQAGSPAKVADAVVSAAAVAAVATVCDDILNTPANRARASASAHVSSVSISVSPCEREHQRQPMFLAVASDELEQFAHNIPQLRAHSQANDSKLKAVRAGCPRLVPTKCCHAADEELPSHLTVSARDLPGGHDGYVADGQRRGRGKVPKALHCYAESIVHGAGHDSSRRGFCSCLYPGERERENDV